MFYKRKKTKDRLFATNLGLSSKKADKKQFKSMLSELLLLNFPFLRNRVLVKSMLFSSPNSYEKQLGTTDCAVVSADCSTVGALGVALLRHPVSSKVKPSLAVSVTFHPMELWLLYIVYSFSDYQKEC